MIERARTAPKHTTAVVAARAPTTDVEGLEAICTPRRGDAPLAPNAPSERPTDAVEAEEKNSPEDCADGKRRRGACPEERRQYQQHDARDEQ